MTSTQPQFDSQSRLMVSDQGNERQAWAPLVLSLVQEIDEKKPKEDRLETQPGLPLPCNYFDFIIGTSTELFKNRRRLLYEPFVAVTKGRIVVVTKRCGNTTSRKSSSKALWKEETKHAKFREQGITDFQGSREDTNILFRSYNHRPRLTDNNRDLNPKSLHHSKLAIHEACSATTAAPTYFHSVRLRGRKYIDGGVWANNPAMIAWNEAVSMGRSPHSNNEISVMPKMLLSIGTGARTEASRLGLSIVGYGFRSITSTTKDEGLAQDAVTNSPGSHYFRFDSARDRDKQLQQRVAASKTGSKTAFDPQTFTYKTFDRIRDRTIHYLHCLETDPVCGQTSTERCALLLWQTAWERKNITETRWLEFRKHPDPSFRSADTPATSSTASPQTAQQ
ncbi:hypothetical protein J7T55_014767 [Diaporthe amygdali]|uniref:uncharacterized protein n=1 Tax=Phomopsis amygdali TaxID=1214568 RepID=UPI0022FF0376|nr:uncharacterized protein J7T55_014767 [Diaporthe amygdali]KAJ0109965.1 hypothetical protein J7T55_014767 [Diaporthe amygdali]